MAGTASSHPTPSPNERKQKCAINCTCVKGKIFFLMDTYQSKEKNTRHGIRQDVSQSLGYGWTPLGFLTSRKISDAVYLRIVETEVTWSIFFLCPVDTFLYYIYIYDTLIVLYNLERKFALKHDTINVNE